MRYLFAATMLTLALPAAAQDDRAFCADRPGLDTPPCVLAPGKMQVEVGLGDWTLERSAGSRTDTLTAGDVLTRIGIADHSEIQLGWTAIGQVRARSGGVVDRSSGTGDVTIALRRSLAHPDGSGTSVALMPYLTLPTGGRTIGAGDWAVGVLVPVSVDIARHLSLAFTPEIDAAVDEDGDGRHLAYGSAAGLSLEVTDTITTTGEFQLLRDRDPGGAHTQALTGLSAAWQPGTRSQIDIGANLGLNAASPDVELYVGIARRF